ncbi:hypothetical protein RDABS01_035963 [Bienertia sinuspersici]
MSNAEEQLDLILALLEKAEETNAKYAQHLIQLHTQMEQLKLSKNTKEEVIKLSDLPELSGLKDPQAYLNWERRVERYFDHKDMDKSMPCGCKEDEEQKSAKFLIGINKNISNQVELKNYSTFDELCQLAIKNKGSRTPFTPKQESSKAFEEYEKPTKSSASSSETSTTKWKNLTPGQIAMKDRICFKCKGGGHLVAHCPTKTLITFEDHHALLEIMIEEEAEKQRPLQRIEQEKEVAQDSSNLYMSTYESKGLSKKERKALKRERFLNIRQGPKIGVGDYVWLSLNE